MLKFSSKLIHNPITFFIFIIFFIVPLFIPTFINFIKGFAKYNTIIELFKLSLASTAFVTALYTLFLKENRLRAYSEYILISLIIFLVPNILLMVSFVICNVTCAAEGIVKHILASLTYFSVLFYILASYFLFVAFLRSYNQLYNLRTNKLYKYFKPIKKIRNFISPYKHYELRVDERVINGDSLKPIRSHLSGEEINKFSHGGASILITGFSGENAIHLSLDLIKERLEAGETANYVISDRHPLRIWEIIKAKYPIPEAKFRDLVFVDAYSPSYAFTDEIQEENDHELNRQGIKYVKAKTFAGLHTAMAKAFNIIKSSEKEKGIERRRPMIAVYAFTSALCEFEGLDQFRIFWRHVIPSEASYGMITIIIEDDLSGDDILIPLKQRVDFAFSFKSVKTEDGNLGPPLLIREK